uniref:ABC transporter domain-containing protein n=2 Tax=Oryza TaxID=4527 RepID=A0A0D3ETI8_9ORYZ
MADPQHVQEEAAGAEAVHAHAARHDGAVVMEILSRSLQSMPASPDVSAYFSGASSRRPSAADEVDDEEALRWAALERLPSFDRLRTGLMRADADSSGVGVGAVGRGRRWYAHREVDVRTLELAQRQAFVERVFHVAEEDNERFLKKLRARIDRAGIQMPTVEVRFRNVNVQAECHVGTRALPTLANVSRDVGESLLGLVGLNFAKRKALHILKDVSGIVRPSRMTLLLGPPSSGKTTLLLALAGKLDPTLETSGEVTYNGYGLDEFVPQKTAAYISQHDVHAGEMTVKETLDFSAKCQGVGQRYELLKELAKKERQLGIYPDPEVDLFMKATSVEGSTLQTDYILRILGLDMCADVIVGDELRRGISGGQKKRLTTAEMLVGPTKVLFMDEISTGLDSSTTFQIIRCIQQIVHMGEATVLVSLLQPAPEIFELFDDVMLLSEGQIVYQGPREHVLEFFERCGFRCPERKGVADFLQEVTSKKDQEQYWIQSEKPYRYVSVPEFVAKFKKFHMGKSLKKQLSVPFNKGKIHKSALVFSKQSVSTLELLKTSCSKEWLLMKRNSFVYIFKTVQGILVALIASTVFLRTQLNTRDEGDGQIYIGALIFVMITNMFSGFADLSLTLARLPVFYKHRDFLFYRPWTFALPNVLVRIPSSLFESIIWVAITYYTMGFAPEASRFFKHLLVVFMLQQMAAGLFRVTAGLCRTVVVTNTAGSLAVLIMFVLGGFILPKDAIPKWWVWAYWCSPLTYAYIAFSSNEMHSPRWMDKFVPDGKRLGVAVLENSGVFTNKEWYWIATGALLGFTILFNVLFSLSLMYLNPVGKPQSILPEETDSQENIQEGKNKAHIKQIITVETPEPVSPNSIITLDKVIQQLRGYSANTSDRSHSYINAAGRTAPGRGMVLPFEPLYMSFNEINYYVDMPLEMKSQGVTADKLQLLSGISGAFRPGVLTALMGVSGAGKTTLMDVLSGRKTGGYIEGEIYISGYPKNQATFARISGYCEQNDIHSPQITVRESLLFSAFLRLPKEVNDQEKKIFVDEVMELVELTGLKDAIVGLPGVNGLSTEQRKRLTIAVELVANPSIIFMDEPTSGLDARAAAIVMRTVRNTVNTGRTVVCTIHQPSIDIFEAFDELLLLKRGGQVIYSGPLGTNSHKVVEYFEAIPGVPKIEENRNPATWMLDVSSAASEVRLEIDFAEYYRSSTMHQRTKALVKELSNPPPGSDDLYFPSQYSQSTFNQFKLCLWKQWWTYWRSPDYNLVRIFFALFTALMLGTIFWRVGHKMESSKDLLVIIGSMYAAVLFVGFENSVTVQPVVAVERTVFYRERAAGMYSAIPYALAQVVVEIPYVFVETVIYTLIVYPMMSFQWTPAKFFWFFYVSFFTFLYFTYYGMMNVSVSPNLQVASILGAAFYTLFNLFSGFFIPRPKIPKWWVWYYWLCPVAWTVYGLIVSQYGDVEDFITVPGQSDQQVRPFIKDYFGYDPDFMGVVAAVLAGFTVFFAFTYAYSIRTLNFQQR